MATPDLFRALLAAALVDALHKDDENYKPFLPNGNNDEKNSDPLSNNDPFKP